jgi:hypothetical protein
MESEVIGILLVPESGAGGTLAARSEAVVPVIGVGKATAGPAQE